jgi:hypothetical protein
MGKQSRLVLAGTSIASALLLLAGGATAAQASTVRHNTVHHNAAHRAVTAHRAVHYSVLRHSAVDHNIVGHSTVGHSTVGHSTVHHSVVGHSTIHQSAVHHIAEHRSAGHRDAGHHSTGRHQRTRRWYRRAGQSQCQMWARAHTFEYLKAAHRAPGGAATLTAKRATVVCGGAEDWHFAYETIPVSSFVESNAHIQVLATTGAGIGFKVIRTTRLVRYLPHDEWTRTFQLTGPPDAITALEEIYHP